MRSEAQLPSYCWVLCAASQVLSSQCEPAETLSTSQVTFPSHLAFFNS